MLKFAPNSINASNSINDKNEEKEKGLCRLRFKSCAQVVAEIDSVVKSNSVIHFSKSHFTFIFFTLKHGTVKPHM